MTISVVMTTLSLSVVGSWEIVLVNRPAFGCPRFLLWILSRYSLISNSNHCERLNQSDFFSFLSILHTSCYSHLIEGEVESVDAHVIVTRKFVFVRSVRWKYWEGSFASRIAVKLSLHHHLLSDAVLIVMNSLLSSISFHCDTLNLKLWIIKKTRFIV